MISQRQLRILEAIISDFIDTAQPVGSRTISKKYPLGISSATIRNEMADLEELGYLEQPHTSSGRIPSDLGYRLYVDSLVNLHSISIEEKELIQTLLLNRLIEANDVAEQSAKLIANFTNLVAIVTIPQFNKCNLANLKLIKVSDSKVLLILVTDTGVVKNVQLALNNTDQFILDKIADTLIAVLQGQTIEMIDMRSIVSIKEKLHGFGDMIDYLIPILRDAFKNLRDNDRFIAGEENLLNIPEFSEIGKARTIFNFVRNEESISELLNTIDNTKLSIRIGSEIDIPELEECALVSSSYKVDGKMDGKIVVLGSKRMDYGNVISFVNYISNTLSDLFSGITL